MPLLRYTAEVNGFDSLIITKLDVLDELKEIPVCVAYEVDGKVVHEMPASTRRMEAIKPVFERLPGWQTKTQGVAQMDKLAEGGAELFEVFGGADRRGDRISVSNGPERNETMIIPGSKLEKLLQ